MKIALVQPKFDQSGGAERYASTVAEGLSDRGHQVHLFGRRVEGLADPIVFHRVRALPFGRAFKTWSFWKASSRAVRTDDFDVVQGSAKTTCQNVHRCGGGVHRAFLERQGGAGKGRRWYDRVAISIEDRIFSGSRLRAVLCPSSWVAGEVTRFYPAVQPKIRVIPNGVDIRRFGPEGRSADRQRILLEIGASESCLLLLFVATNFALKGLDTAVAALSSLPGAHLAVVGGDDAKPFQREAGERGVGERVHFLGARTEVAPLYRAADALLHPTRYDPFANVCAEALACGTPVVTTARDGVSDLLRESNAGEVMSVGDPEAAAASVLKLVARGPDAREEARRLACRNDVANHLGRLEALYSEVASGPERASNSA